MSNFAVAEKDSVYSKRYALLAQMKPEKFQYVAQESVMVRAYSVDCITIRATKVFSGPHLEEWKNTAPRFSV